MNDRILEETVQTLREGGIILYPTETVWGLGCDPGNENAIRRIFEIKKRPKNKGMILLVSDIFMLQEVTGKLDPPLLDYLVDTTRPTTVIYPEFTGLPDIVSDDGTIAIRVTSDAFCKEMIEQFGNPVVSTSANLSGEAPSNKLAMISHEIKASVDHIVDLKDKQGMGIPSRIIKWNNGQMELIRE